MISSVWVRWPSSDTAATRTANTAMVSVTGARSGCSRACSACSCNSLSSSLMLSAPLNSLVESRASSPGRHTAGPAASLRQASETSVFPLHKFVTLAAHYRTATHITTNYEDNPTFLFSHHFNNDSFVPLPIKLRIENLLPRTEVEPPIRDRNNNFVMHDQRFQVRVPIVLARLMMLIILPERGQRLQPGVDILDKPALVVIHINPRRDMHRRDQNHPVLNPGFPKRALHLRSQMNISSFSFRVQRQVLSMESHGLYLT